MSASGAGRDKRIAERIRADIMDLVLRGAIRDPDVQGVIVSAVDVSADLSVARVWLRALEGDVDAGRRKRLVAAMKRAGGFVRRELGRTLQVRRVPELRFEWDEGADRAARVEALLDEIASEQRAASKKSEGEGGS